MIGKTSSGGCAKNTDTTRLEQQFDFLREIDREKEITRQTFLISGNRKEGDAEHAWHLAIMAYLLGEYANEGVDLARVMVMVLIHDLVEIDAGDTYAYDAAGKSTQHQREVVAAERIFGLLPEEQGRQLREIWEEFEDWQTPEAKFARALDHIQPLMLNDASGGKSWKEHRVHVNQVLNYNRRSGEGSRTLWEFARDTMLLPHAGKELDSE